MLGSTRSSSGKVERRWGGGGNGYFTGLTTHHLQILILLIKPKHAITRRWFWCRRNLLLNNSQSHIICFLFEKKDLSSLFTTFNLLAYNRY